MHAMNIIIGNIAIICQSTSLIIYYICSACTEHCVSLVINTLLVKKLKYILESQYLSLMPM
jgi:hypothetical protein